MAVCTGPDFENKKEKQKDFQDFLSFPSFSLLG